MPTFKVELDFNTALNQANKASKQISDMYSKAFVSGLADWDVFGRNFRKNLDKVGKYEIEIANKRREVEGRNILLREKSEKNLANFVADKKRELADLERKLNGEVTAEKRKGYKAEIKAVNELISLSDKLNDNASKFADDARDLEKEVAKSSKQMAKLAKYMSASSEAASDIRQVWKDLKDPTKLGENLEGMASTFGEAFGSGIDVQSLAKSLGQGTGKWLGKGMQAIGGGGAGMAAAAGAIAGVVAGLGILIAAFIGVEKKVKEFNKEIIKTYGALSLARLGGGRLDAGLRILKRTVMDLTANFGVNEDEAKQLFDSLDKGGVTLDRITRGTLNATEAQIRLGSTLRGMYTVANMMGVGLSEYADNLTNYVNDLAMSVETVNDSFASIAKMASESAFGTRRFYSMVVQATAGQASLNVSLEQTGDLLLRMSKIMGAKKAAEMVGSAAGDMGGLSAQDRIKNVLIAGARGRRRFGVEARQQAGTFAQGVNTRGQRQIIVDALRAANITGDGITQAISNQDPTSLVHSLGQLNQREQGRLIAQLRSQGTEDAEAIARQLDQLTSLSRGSQRGMNAMVNSMESFSAGGSIAYRLDEVQNVVGGRLENLSAAQRAAAESVLGMSGHQYDAMRDYSRSLQGSFDLLTGHVQQGVEFNSDMDKRLIKLYGATVRDGRIVAAHLEANGSVSAQTGEQIRTANDLSQAYSRATGDEITNLREEATSLAQETMDATVSIQDILDNKISQLIQRVFEALDGPIGSLLRAIADAIPGTGDTAQQVAEQQGLMAEITGELKNLAQNREDETRELARLRVTATSNTATADKRREARGRIAEIERGRGARTDETNRLRAARESVAGGGDVGSARTMLRGVQAGRSQRNQAALSNVLGTGTAVGAAPSGLVGTTNMDARAEAFLQSLPARPGGRPAIPTPTTPARAAPSATPAPTAPAGRTSLITPAPAGTSEWDNWGNVAPIQRIAAPAAPTPVVPATAAPAPAAPAPAAPAPAPPPEPPSRRVAEAAQEPVVGEVANQTDAQKRAAAQQKRRDIESRREQHQDLMKLTGRALGDELAGSKLPDAIAFADAKMRLLEQLGPTPPTGDDLTRLLSGTATQAQVEAMHLPETAAPLARALRMSHGMAEEPPAHDFVYRNDGGRGVITPIDRADQLVGSRPGGPIATAAGRGGGNVVINIQGGDQRQVFETVRRAIVQAGITPNRVPSGGA